MHLHVATRETNTKYLPLKKETQTVRFNMCVYRPLKQTGQDKEKVSVMK